MNKFSTVRVRLIRKLADCIDGVDLRRVSVGDLLELPVPEAGLLIAEGWAVEETRAQSGADGERQRRAFHSRRGSSWPRFADAADGRGRIRPDEVRLTGVRELHRSEDRLRDEMRDRRSRVISVAATHTGTGAMPPNEQDTGDDSETAA